MPVEVAGLVLGLAGLFSSCLECWHLLEDGRAMGRDFVIQRQKYVNLRLRFQLWGEVCGLDTAANGSQGFIPDRIRPNVQDTLECIYTLFKDGKLMKEKYGLKPKTSLRLAIGVVGRSLLPLNISRASSGVMERNMKEIRKQAGFFRATRWAISDKAKFEGLVDHLNYFIDDLNKITESMNVLERQRQLAENTFSQIEDIERLKTIEEARTGPEDIISDAASTRISTIRSGRPGTSFYTAPSEPERAQPEPIMDQVIFEDEPFAPLISEKSQWERLLGTLQRNDVNSSRELPLDGSRSGDLLLHFKLDMPTTERPSLRPPPAARADRRMSYEVQRLGSVHVPFAHGWLINNNLRDVFAAIEGPINTPYEGGVFYLRISIPDEYPMKPSKFTFLTKVYHPNIDATGNICADLLKDKWSPVYSTTTCLTAISSILAEPNIDDPLVQDIAATLIQDPETYEENARAYTIRYANPEKVPYVADDGSVCWSTVAIDWPGLTLRLAQRLGEDLIFRKSLEEKDLEKNKEVQLQVSEAIIAFVGWAVPKVSAIQALLHPSLESRLLDSVRSRLRTIWVIIADPAGMPRFNTLESVQDLLAGFSELLESIIVDLNANEQCCVDDDSN